MRRRTLERLMAAFVGLTVVFLFYLNARMMQLSEGKLHNGLVVHSNDLSSPSSNGPIHIRSWGCNRSETPLIFVHIGKAGGGRARARFAAAAQNYSRDKWWAPERDNHYYPIDMENGIFAKLCHKPMPNFRLPGGSFQSKSVMEGIAPCSAITPLGMGLACPGPAFRCLGCQNSTTTNCRTIYSSHNYMGSELHWLPPRYLQHWWTTTQISRSIPDNDNLMNGHDIYDGLRRIQPKNPTWCSSQNISRPLSSKLLKRNYDVCSIPLAKQWDAIFQSYWNGISREMFDDQELIDAKNYGPIYASLPVQRVTILRDPFSWLMSKFFWHTDVTRGHSCDDLEAASQAVYPNQLGWAVKFSLHYIFYLCGGDCILRFESNQTTLQEIEVQAMYNLRHSFSVVGILEHTEEQFYDLVSTRAQYVNMSMNPRITGKAHPGVPGSESQRCRALYRNVSFQQRMLATIPEVAALKRLYELGLEVNHFHYEELSACPNSFLSRNTISH